MDDYITTKELAARLGSHANTVRRWASAHILDGAILRATPQAHPRYYFPAVVQILKQRGISFPGMSSGDNQRKNK